MTAPREISALGKALLARLLVAPAAGATQANLKDVGKLLEHRLSSSEAAGTLGLALDDLASAGLVDRIKKGKTVKLALTDEGRRVALEVLGLAELPPKSTWAALKKTHLAALALGLPAPKGESAKRLGGNPGFQAALLRSRHDLPLDAYPTLPQAADALAWKLLGLDGKGPISRASILKAVFNRELGEHRQGDDKKALQKLISRAAKARRDDANELRDAVLRDWLDGETAQAPSPAPKPSEPLDLPTFARRALELARSSPTGRFGDNKVFIAHAWRAAKSDPAFRDMPLDEFKRRLTEANQARHLDLSRADLVEAMEPEDVRESEARHFGAAYHFIRI